MLLSTYCIYTKSTDMHVNYIMCTLYSSSLHRILQIHVYVYVVHIQSTSQQSVHTNCSSNSDAADFSLSWVLNADHVLCGRTGLNGRGFIIVPVECGEAPPWGTKASNKKHYKRDHKLSPPENKVPC